MKKIVFLFLNLMTLNAYTCPLTLYMKTSRTLCTGYGIRTDNIVDWVLNNSVNLGGNRKND